jgi:hypothetical protein
MADWQTVRYDPTYEEKLDPEIIPLCDALNAAGIVTTSSCCGHGAGWPHVWFEHAIDERRIESLARFVKDRERGDYRPYFTSWTKEILLEALPGIYGPHPYHWCVEIHLNNVYADTPPKVALAMAVDAIDATARAVLVWASSQEAIDRFVDDLARITRPLLAGMTNAEREDAIAKLGKYLESLGSRG